MRRLLPDGSAEVDLDAAYAWPASAGQLVRANMVASVDGAAWVDGHTERLSGPVDKRVFAVLRGLADVVLVGAATVRREDYGPARPSPDRQERRRAAGLPAVPPIAVVSASLELDPTARFFQLAAARPLVLTVADAPAERQAALARVADVVVAGEGRVDVVAALAALADRGFRHVLCEGGPTLLGAVAAAGRLDELCLTVAPYAVAGDPGRILTGALAEPLPLTLRHALAADGVLLLRYAVSGRAGAGTS